MSDSTRILMFGWEYAPLYTGGLGIVTRSILENLKKQGLDVIFVLPRFPISEENNLEKILDASKIHIQTDDANIVGILKPGQFIGPYITLPNFSKSNPTGSTGTNSQNLYGPNLFDEIEMFASRARIIAKRNKHDIIHSHDWMTAKAGIGAKEVSGKPHIMHVHATEFDRTGDNPNQLIYNIERESFEKSDKIIAVSQLTKDKIVRYYGIPSEKIEVVHNAIDRIPNARQITSRINQKDKIVLFLGRLTLQKGGNYLLEAAAKILKFEKNVKFIFVGQGDMLEELIELTIKLGIEKKVMFAGFMNHEEIDQAYQMADVYVMPSICEPFGISALEAINNGTPVIVSKQSGVCEVLQHSLKVDFWDTDELANQILALINYSPLGKFLVKNAKHELQNLDWKNQSKKIIDVYSNLKNHYE